MRQNLLILIGILGVIAGLLFMLQGLGIVRAPVSSPMIGNQAWVTRGAIIAVLSAILIGGVRLVPTRAERKALRRTERDQA